MINQADFLIKRFGMQKHPEGGYFQEFYRSKEIIKAVDLPKRFASEHSFSTAIYFLLKSSQVSKFHKIKSDEIWHFCSGSPLKISIIDENGELIEKFLGNNPESNENFNIIVPANNWMGAEVCNKDSYSLVCCTVAPSFEFNDFELAKKAELLDKFPQHNLLINKLC